MSSRRRSPWARSGSAAANRLTPGRELVGQQTLAGHRRCLATDQRSEQHVLTLHVGHPGVGEGQQLEHRRQGGGDGDHGPAPLQRPSGPAVAAGQSEGGGHRRHPARIEVAGRPRGAVPEHLAAQQGREHEPRHQQPEVAHRRSPVLHGGPPRRPEAQRNQHQQQQGEQHEEPEDEPDHVADVGPAGGEDGGAGARRPGQGVELLEPVERVVDDQVRRPQPQHEGVGRREADHSPWSGPTAVGAG